MNSFLAFYAVVNVILFVDIDGAKQKMIYCNDQGYPGCDGDNPQGMVHVLFYANDVDLQLIIASGSTNCAAAGTNVNEANNILSLYEKDLGKLNSSSVASGGNAYPSYNTLKAMTMQGCTHSSPSAGYPANPIAASNAIIQVVDSLGPDEVVWYGAGAGLCELARALHDKPSIQDKIKLYSISSWNTQQDPYARSYIFQNFPNLFWIESNITYPGWFVGGDQNGDYSNNAYDSNVIKKAGALGNYYAGLVPSQSSSHTPMFQEGDGPSYFYVIDRQHQNRNLLDPTQPSWGGSYKQTYSNRPNYFCDKTSDNNQNWATINQFRQNYLDDWTKRLKWLY